MANEQAKQFLDQATQSLQSGQFAQALELVDQAIAIDPGDPDSHILRGICLAQTSQPDQATESFQKAIMLSPNSSKAYYNLSVHYYGIGRKSESLDLAKDALRVDPQHGGARDMISRVENELNPEMKAKPQAPPANAGDDLVREPERQTYQSSGGHTHGFQQPPQGGYYRPGYQPGGGGQPVHSLQFVEKMGPAWNTIGWVIIVLGVVFFVLTIVTSIDMITEIFKNPAAAQNRNPWSNMNVFGLLSYIPLIGSFVWLIMDIVDRRGNWLWMLPQVICCCCGAYWAVHAIYMLAGRKQ